MEHEIPEQEILDRLAANDSTALEMIWNAYSSDLLGYLVGFFCSRDEAEDTLQDVFVAIAKKRETVAQALKLKPYLFRLARNLALNRIGKEKRKQQGSQEVGRWLEIEGEGMEHSLDTERVEIALSELPEDQRSVIGLKFFRHMTFQEIARMLEISQNTAASRYRYGMGKLKTLLKVTLS